MKFLSYSVIGLLLASGSLFFLKNSDSVKPRISIITSVWKGDLFIEGFMEDITKQTIFDLCELILINANSPGNEEEVILKYLSRYPNIKYVKLNNDPGLYAVWNRAIKMASADIITNANIDDRSEHNSLESHLKVLDDNPDIDLAYAGYLVTYVPNETYEKNSYRWATDVHEFSPASMGFCLPGPRPVWRKSMHEKWGYFNEHLKSAGDWEMWLRAVAHGSKFKSIPHTPTLFYVNPEGISTNNNPNRAFQRHLEESLVSYNYRYLWRS